MNNELLKNIPIETRAKILIEALPYIQEYYNKIVVIKYGGNAMLNRNQGGSCPRRRP